MSEREQPPFPGTPFVLIVTPYELCAVCEKPLTERHAIIRAHMADGKIEERKLCEDCTNELEAMAEDAGIAWREVDEDGNPTDGGGPIA